MAPTRSSTKFVFNVGYVFITLIAFLVVAGFLKGTIDHENIGDVLWFLGVTSASYFGINLARVASENIFGVKAPLNSQQVVDTMTPPDVTVKTDTAEVKVKSGD